MKVYINVKAFGRDEKGRAIINYDDSSRIVFGIFANLEAIALVVCKIYYDSVKWDVIDDWFSKSLNIDEANYKYLEFINKYNLKSEDVPVFGNEIAQHICQLPIAESDDREGFEIVNFSSEKLIFAVQSVLHKINFNRKIKESWESELINYDFAAIRKNEKTYPRVSALASIILGAKPCTNWFLVRVPDRSIRRELFKKGKPLQFAKTIACTENSHQLYYEDLYIDEKGKSFVRIHGSKSQEFGRPINFDEWEEID